MELWTIRFFPGKQFHRVLIESVEVRMRRTAGVMMCIAAILLAASADDGPKNSSSLITAKELKTLIGRHTLRLIDLRGNEEYKAGHIPGALPIKNQDFEDPNHPVNGMLAPAAQFQNLMSAKGVGSQDLIVAYADSRKPQMATRLWWALKVYGHKKAQVLDGHYQAWEDAGYPVETGARAEPVPMSYKTAAIESRLVASKRDCLNPLMNTVLLDVRPDQEYTGEKVAANAGRGGHIPGAINVHYLDALDEKGFFKDIQILKAIYARAGITPDKEVIVYCMRGHRASHTCFVLAGLLGYPNIRLYDGSWIEWSNSPEIPVTTGRTR